MKLKQLVISASLVSLLGFGMMSQIVSADEQQATTAPSTVQNNIGYNRANGPCYSLTEEQQKLIEESYNSLSKEEKDFYNQYYRQSKRDLTEDDINKYYAIHDKIYSVLGEDFVNSVKERRSNPMRGQGQGKGMGRGQGQCGVVANQ